MVDSIPSKFIPESQNFKFATSNNHSLMDKNTNSIYKS